MNTRFIVWLATTAVAAAGCSGIDVESAELGVKNNKLFANPLGGSATYSTLGGVDLESAFFGDFGTNARTCGSCHAIGEGWTISAERVQERFAATGGLDPIFRLVDGANSPLADDSTVEARLEAYSMLLDRGVIRVGIGIPAGAEFELVGIDDPYGYASAAELSLFRRPLPSANLGFIPAVMWDGRVAGTSIEAALADQAVGATLGHAEASEAPPAEVVDEIVAFETAMTNAQLVLEDVGRLDRDGVLGGPEALVTQSREGGPFTLFDGWVDGSPDASRAAVARGQALFNQRGCNGCHGVANVGTSAAPIFFDIGVSAGARRTADLPLYTLRNLATGEVRTTTDPGRALITGLWRDVDRFKAPSLRALAARAPYFHNGAAATLEDVVAHYVEALGFQFTGAERADLVMFLSAL
jgi:cytochrome c peroxidase